MGFSCQRSDARCRADRAPAMFGDFPPRHHTGFGLWKSTSTMREAARYLTVIASGAPGHRPQPSMRRTDCHARWDDPVSFADPTSEFQM